MALTTYRRKRRFDKTPEPAGKARAARGRDGNLAFVIQKHDATRLHYDLRLELDGVMKSWAVPKGPSLDPSVKRLAVHVEDHPIEYNAFEGVIPEGEYGGGPVLIWDRGRWIPEEDPRQGYKKGALKFRLDGEKLHGSWALVRTKGWQGKKEQWLLIKHKDDAAKRGAAAEIVNKRPESVATDRTIEEIGPSRRRPASKDPKALPGARPARLPAELSPELATLVDEAPPGPEWFHEIKYDGYRLLCRIANGKARLYTRRGNDWTSKFGTLAADVAKLPVREAWIDGEVVAAGERGNTSFGALQEALGSNGGTEGLVFYAFDVPYLDGHDLTRVPLVQRKAALSKILGRSKGRIRYSDHVEGRGDAFFDGACRQGLEGIVSKRAASPYRSGRGRDWLKVKCIQTRELVVVGYTEPKGSRTGLGALVLAEAAGMGQLRHVGRVGTGFDERALEDLTRRLSKLESAKPAVSPAPKGAAARGVHWVKPKLVAEVAFTERTRDGILRHPVFRGLREDKTPRETAGEAAGTELEASEDAVAKTTVEGVRLTNPDKVLYPDAGITKRRLIDYYTEVEERLMPYLKDRPLTVVRCPDGYQKFCFFQKHIEGEPPKGLAKKPGDYFYATSLLGVLELVQLGALELHVWGSHAKTVERPDLMIFDVDPDAGLPWPRVVEACQTMRSRLTELGLASWLKTTGGKGLHVCVPLGRRQDWAEVKAFSKVLAEDVVAREPAKYTANPLKVKRKGRVFLDYLRNGRGATAVAAWSTRARAGATVSMPLDWSELDAKLRPSDFTVETAGRRLRGEDPWSGFYASKQTITAAMRKALSVPT
jgi:bifunctional non-homologous end joining protein LigD